MAKIACEIGDESSAEPQDKCISKAEKNIRQNNSDLKSWLPNRGKWLWNVPGMAKIACEIDNESNTEPQDKCISKGREKYKANN